MISEETDTVNDALMAAMMQQEVDEEIMATERHRNGNSKVRLSSYQNDYLDCQEEMSEDREHSFYGRCKKLHEL